MLSYFYLECMNLKRPSSRATQCPLDALHDSLIPLLRRRQPIPKSPEAMRHALEDIRLCRDPTPLAPHSPIADEATYPFSASSCANNNPSSLRGSIPATPNVAGGNPLTCAALAFPGFNLKSASRPLPSFTPRASKNNCTRSNGITGASRFCTQLDTLGSRNLFTCDS